MESGKAQKPGRQLSAAALRAANLLIVCVLLLSCTKRRTDVRVEDPRNAEVEACVAEADTYFRQLHLYAWRKAESLYSKAQEIKQAPELTDKLLLTGILRVTRERQENILGATAPEALDELCGEPPEGPRARLCGLADAYLGGKEKTKTKYEFPGSVLPPGEADPALSAYLDLLAVGAANPSAYEQARNQFIENFPSSPLTLYIVHKEGRPEVEGLLNPDEHFAEHLLYRGGLFLEKTRYAAGIESLARAIELVPDYTKAYTALGDFWLFIVLDSEEAIANFERALSFDPGNPAALFGKAVALHYLEKNIESNITLDRLLANRERWDDFGQALAYYYRDQIPYYQGYNHYLSGSLGEARDWIDQAKQSQPESEMVSYVSGLIYLRDHSLPRAEADLEDATQTGEICDAYYRLGLINDEDQPKRAVSLFLAAAYCTVNGVQELERSLKRLGQLDLDETSRTALRLNLHTSLEKRRESAIATLEDMIARTRPETVAQKTIHIETMIEFLSELKKSL